MNTNLIVPITLGVDKESHEPIHIDLAKCGSILLAGATKQGKSHCIHDMISQIEHLASPPRVIIFDPKRCEFSNYKDRYQIIETLHDAKTVLFTELFEGEICKRSLSACQDHSPIIIVIDELLDLIFMHNSKSKQHFDDRLRYEAIIKLLTIGPNLNIFSIIATQSLDKNILTKEILDICKTRIAFRTINSQDSKRIIKKTGAENLLGRGDTIFYQEGSCQMLICH